MKTIRLLTFNIHKGFTAGKRNFVLKPLKRSLEKMDLDFACLQEVVGHHVQHENLNPDWNNSSQFEYLAHGQFPHYVYGKNAIYRAGNHGNAILSRHPISAWENEDVSLTKIERRGLLHAIDALLLAAYAAAVGHGRRNKRALRSNWLVVDGATRGERARPRRQPTSGCR